MKEQMYAGAKSMVMVPLYASKTQVDQKKKSQLMRKQKHKGSGWE